MGLRATFPQNSVPTYSALDLKAGSTIEECKEVTGHLTDSMFLRYAALFNDEERRTRRRNAQKQRHEWRDTERECVEEAQEEQNVGKNAGQELNRSRSNDEVQKEGGKLD